MTEQVQGAIAAHAQPSDQVIAAPVVPPAPTERLIPQSEVNRLVGAVKDEYYQKGLKESRLPAGNPSVNQNGDTPSSTHNNSVLSESDQQKLIAEGVAKHLQAEKEAEQQRAQAAEQARQVEQVNHLVGSVLSKLEKAKDSHADPSEFERSVASLNIIHSPAAASVLQAASKIENSPDVLYHLSQHPGKWAQIQMVGYSPELVEKSMREIAESLKANHLSAQQRPANAPLRHPTPSTIGSGNGADLSIKDYKRIYKG